MSLFCFVNCVCLVELLGLFCVDLDCVMFRWNGNGYMEVR